MASLFKFVITLFDNGKHTAESSLFTENDASAAEILNDLNLYYSIDDVSDIKRSTKSYKVVLQSKTESVEASGVLATSLRERVLAYTTDTYSDTVKAIIDDILSKNTKVFHDTDAKKTGMRLFRIVEEGPIENLIKNL